MNILYIGHYKESSGWSQAAIDYILALDAAGENVVCRNITLTKDSVENLPKRILELEQKNLQDIDVCIQHVLPHHLVPTEKFKKNIAYFVFESSTIKHIPWLGALKQMDEVWVPNTDAKNRLISDGLVNVKVVPHTFDMIKYRGFYNHIAFPDLSTFKFYTILDLNERKNLESIIKSFHSEFQENDNVDLVLKVKKYGVSDEVLFRYVNDFCSDIKKKLRIHKDVNRYKQEIIICGSLKEEQILSLHSSCNCFINVSHGEAWSIPTFDAMCFGNTPISCNEGGPKEYISDDKNCGTLVNGVYSVCCQKDAAFDFIFTGKEEWFTPSEREIKAAMRYYYENRDNINKDCGFEQGKNFSYENIGKLIKDYINE